MATLRSLVPLSEGETDEVFARVADTIHATISGARISVVQGTLGGLMFWWLGLPASTLWGTVMALLAIVPVLGAFVIWLPAAIFLAVTGEWGKAAILTAWGATIVVALIENLLYSILVGKRLRLHTVPVFFAIVGGLALFGAAALILGPVILALTDAILEIWRRRTAHGRPAEEPSDSSNRRLGAVNISEENYFGAQYRRIASRRGKKNAIIAGGIPVRSSISSLQEGSCAWSWPCRAVPLRT